MNGEGITIQLNEGSKVFVARQTTNLAQQMEATLMKSRADEQKKFGFISTRRYTNGSIVQIHKDADKDKTDSKDIVRIAGLLAKESPSIVQVTPRVHTKDSLYDKIYGDNRGTPYKNKCQDLKIIHYDGRRELVEYESYVRPSSSHSIPNMMRHGLEQSSRLIVDIRNGINLSELRNSIKGRKKTTNIDYVRVYDGKSVKDFYTKEKGFVYKKKKGASRKASTSLRRTT